MAIEEGSINRDRLMNLPRMYLDGLVAHDLSRVPLASNVKLTENGQALSLGRGLARTIKSVAPEGQCFADTESGQVGYWTSLEEIGGPAIIALRLRAQKGQVSEIETLLIRGGGVMFSPESLAKPRVVYSETLEHDARSSREALIDAANLYFDGIERADGDMIPAAEECVRIENGVQTTLRLPDAPHDEEFPGLTMGVAEQINSGYFTYIESISDRRVSVVDDERGLVLCHVRFDHPGNVTTASGQTPFGFPNSVLIHEVFKVSKGLIRHVEAVGSVFPYLMGSGW